MMTHHTSALARRVNDREELEEHVRKHLTAGGRVAILPYLARSKPRMPKDYQSEAPRVRGIAAESRSKKRAADQQQRMLSEG